MTRQPAPKPDALAKGASHVIVGVASAIVVGYVIVNLAGLRKASPRFQLVAAAGIWLHSEMDLLLARRLAEAGL